MTKPSKWIVVTDFDGTLARKDVGDELCREALGKRFDELLAKYRGGDSNLLEYQGEVWPNFPMPEPLFRERSRFHGELRPGVGKFLRKCRAKNIPVYVASCGVVTYIESVLDAHLSPEERKAIVQIRANTADFGPHGFTRFEPAERRPGSTLPLEKGLWAAELKKQHGARALGIGNGSSDASFWPHVDRLAATDKFASWCAKSKVPHVTFETFDELLNLEIFE